jgi:hypothetical protein
MSRISEIKSEITNTIQAVMPQLNSVSNTAVFKNIAYAIACIAQAIENQFAVNQNEIQSIIETKAHTLLWYAQKAKAFRLGQPLDDFGEYLDTGLNDEEVVFLQCVKDAVALEQDGLLLIKIRGANQQPISSDSEVRLTAYLHLVKDAGVPLQVVNLRPDSIKMSVNIYVNLATAPIFADLNLETRRTISDIITAMPFGGALYVSDLIAHLNRITGIRSSAIHDLSGKRHGSTVFLTYSDRYEPYSGYCIFENEIDLIINLIQ